MRIVSKFYDYYDKALAYGIDTDILYVRETKEIILPPILYWEPQKSQERQKFELFKLAQDLPRANVGDRIAYIVAFCGKIYPVYAFNFGWGLDKSDYKFYYSIDSIRRDFNNKEFITAANEKYSKENVDDALEEISLLLSNKTGYYHQNIKVDNVDNLIGKEIGDDVFRYYDSPIILVRAKHSSADMPITINPRLNEIDFIKAVDPVTAFQEISMYLGSNLAKQKDPEVNHSDELKAEIHGFNKWSFRKQGKNNK